MIENGPPTGHGDTFDDLLAEAAGGIAALRARLAEAKERLRIRRSEHMTVRFDDKVTNGDKYGPAMEIIDQAEADAYFEACVEHRMRFGKTRQEAEEIERRNLGYWAGQYSRKSAERVFRLFKCAHPILGTRTDVTFEEAYEAGRRMAEPTKG